MINPYQSPKHTKLWDTAVNGQTTPAFKKAEGRSWKTCRLCCFFSKAAIRGVELKLNQAEAGMQRKKDAAIFRNAHKLHQQLYKLLSCKFAL